MTRFDDARYRTYRYRLAWDGHPVAGAHRIGALKRTTAVSHGAAAHEAVTIEDGVTYDAGFVTWASAVRAATDAPARGLRRDVTIEVRDLAGRIATTFRVSGCWVSAWQALPDLDGAGDAVTIRYLRLENEGWARDVATPGVSGPS